MKAIVSRIFFRGYALFGAALVASLASCGDPIIDGGASALGKETSGIPKGEFHRAGQPCVVCHQEHGAASDDPFTVAGTVFAGTARMVGVDRAEIRLTDAAGTKFTTHTNCVGNFFVKPADWSPSFPILVSIAKNNIVRNMQGVIGRDGSCAHCHVNAVTPTDPASQVQHIYLFGADEPGAPNGSPQCTANPIAAASPN
jgi:hypothetical protein